MNQSLSLAGTWQFRLDTEKQGLTKHYENIPYTDTITLPNTVAMAKKGTPDVKRETGYLTDPYHMEGYTWYRKDITLPFRNVEDLHELHFQLHMERTRISHVWVDGTYVGTCDSFIAPHIYDLTPYIHTLSFTLTIMISNTDYKIPGGHMTSPDTQTNWNGILGEICLSWDQGIRIEHPAAVSDLTNHALALTLPVMNDTKQAADLKISVSARLIARSTDNLITESDSTSDSPARPASLTSMAADPTTEEVLLNTLCTIKAELPTLIQSVLIPAEGDTLHISYDISGHEALWSEYHPDLYAVTVELLNTDSMVIFRKTFFTAQRTFTTEDGAFMINGHRTFLRGKHDGMVFPITGFAPMNVEGWLTVMQTAKEYGINHYRFHTCCPPEAAFLAADLLGIYMQPELPFWGNFYGPEDEEYPKEAQEFLREEGFRMLSEFSSHPSYCMMSMGNELWGNPSAINDLMGDYKAYRPHILYTQGSNNFQWTPNIQPNDDFFSGVRFTIDRQIRGSYAMCDKPLGHVQVDRPGTRYNYEEAIHPSYQSKASAMSEDGTIEIQYGTGVKRVKLTEVQEELNPAIPVISHEVGQYCTYPDYNEIPKYTGVLKARNFEVFKERLAEKHLDHLAEEYFKNSGALAAACYKDEIETAMRTPSLAGYQLLDIQDFPGQGTALVGILNAFMDNKGIISRSDWREFCSDAVLQAEFDSYIIQGDQDFSFTVSLAYYREEALTDTELSVTLRSDKTGACVTVIHEPCPAINEAGRHILGTYTIQLPEDAKKAPDKWTLTLTLKHTDIHNHYTLWSYPNDVRYGLSANNEPILSKNPVNNSQTITEHPAIAHSMEEAKKLAKDHKKVLLFLSEEDNPDSIQGTYCTDFWCYPMFKSISESIGKEIPTGTLGLLIRKDHPALADFPCETYTTPQWYSIVNASRSTILDDTEIRPIVQTIDNFERNHRLGLLYELPVPESDAIILVCTSNLPKLIEQGVTEAGQLYSSLIHYILNESSRG